LAGGHLHSALLDRPATLSTERSLVVELATFCGVKELDPFIKALRPTVGLQMTGGPTGTKSGEIPCRWFDEPSRCPSPKKNLCDTISKSAWHPDYHVIFEKQPRTLVL
jgi:hypothetical protein